MKQTKDRLTKGVSHWKKRKPKEVVRPESSHTVLLKGNKSWRSDKTKEKSLGFWVINLCGKLMDGKTGFFRSGLCVQSQVR